MSVREWECVCLTFLYHLHKIYYYQSFYTSLKNYVSIIYSSWLHVLLFNNPTMKFYLLATARPNTHTSRILMAWQMQIWTGYIYFMFTSATHKKWKMYQHVVLQETIWRVKVKLCWITGDIHTPFWKIMLRPVKKIYERQR